MTSLRTRFLAQPLQVFSKSLQNSTRCNMLHVQKACLLSPTVQNSVVSSEKDELYRQITIEVKGHDKEVLKSYQMFFSMAAKELDIHVEKIYDPPSVISRISLMKSVFIHKRHFHQYEMRTLYKVFEIKYLTRSTASTFLEYIQRNLPEGIAMKVTKHQIEKFPAHIKPPSATMIHTTSPVPEPKDTAKSTPEPKGTAKSTPEPKGTAKSTTEPKGTAKSTSSEVANSDQKTKTDKSTKTKSNDDAKASKSDSSTSSLPKSNKNKKQTSKKITEDKS